MKKNHASGGKTCEHRKPGALAVAAGSANNLSELSAVKFRVLQLESDLEKAKQARISAEVDSALVAIRSSGSAGWMPPESAPKSGCVMILGDFGWPWPVPAVWDAFGEEWCIATMQTSQMKDGPDNTWLEIDHERKLTRWMPLPSLPNDQDQTAAESGSRKDKK